jgi:hypothetical protein
MSYLLYIHNSVTIPQFVCMYSWFFNTLQLVMSIKITLFIIKKNARYHLVTDAVML